MENDKEAQPVYSCGKKRSFCSGVGVDPYWLVLIFLENRAWSEMVARSCLFSCNEGHLKRIVLSFSLYSRGT